MTEAEWLACTDPPPMLEFLRGKTSDRKLRLFSVACCRAIWLLLAEKPQSRPCRSQPFLLDHDKRIIQSAEPFLEVAEQYADGQAGSDEIGTAYGTLLGLLYMRRPRQEPWAFALVALFRAVSTGGRFYGQEWECQTYDAIQCAKDVGGCVAQVAGWIGTAGADDKAMRESEATNLRCICGNPFRPATIDPSWRAWNNCTIPEFAQAIYDQRVFDRLPILADSLEAAGCHDADILAHCRHAGPHVRGCWVVDILLGKE